jgi:hypothetical protein
MRIIFDPIPLAARREGFCMLWEGRALPCTRQGNFLKKVSLDPSKTFGKFTD